MRRGLILGLLLLLASVARADYLEVRRSSVLRSAPDKTSERLLSLENGYLLLLVSTTQTNGYYHAEDSASGEDGWIYRTFVRRYPGDPPETDDDGGPIEASGGVDVSAFRTGTCPLQGDAIPDHVKALNLLKNRTVGPPSSGLVSVTAAEVLEPGDDHGRWVETDGVELTGYVFDVKKGGVETCNCHAKATGSRDTHIEITRGPTHTQPSDRMVVEITPAWRAYMATQGRDWTTEKLEDSLEGHWVRLRGWLFFDTEHADEAENTAPGDPDNWRGTAWEVHPVTFLEVLAGPPGTPQ